MSQRHPGEVGLQLVITYKFVKGAVELAGGFILAWFAFHNEVGALERLARMLGRQVAHPAALELAKLIVRVSTPHFLRMTAVALVLDGLVSFFEGWALHRRFWWAPWLVVVATSVLLPYELLEVSRHPRIGRVLILVINAAVVFYLSRRALSEHRTNKLLRKAREEAL